jgi:hypothetical protein
MAIYHKNKMKMFERKAKWGWWWHFFARNASAGQYRTEFSSRTTIQYFIFSFLSFKSFSCFDRRYVQAIYRSLIYSKAKTGVACAGASFWPKLHRFYEESSLWRRLKWLQPNISRKIGKEYMAKYFSSHHFISWGFFEFLIIKGNVLNCSDLLKVGNFSYI